MLHPFCAINLQLKSICTIALKLSILHHFQDHIWKRQFINVKVDLQFLMFVNAPVNCLIMDSKKLSSLIAVKISAWKCLSCIV